MNDAKPLKAVFAAMAALFAACTIALADCDSCGWRRVSELPVPKAVLLRDEELPRSAPGPQDPTTLDLGLTNRLPASAYARVRELARGLDYDEGKCYRYVRDNIAHASYFGILKGPERTLLDREGNELDQSFLLLALLRACGRADAGIAYSPLDVSNGVANACFRIPLRKQESGSDYNAADWLGVAPSGSLSEVYGRVSLLLAMGYHFCRQTTIGGAPFVELDHFYVTLPADGGTYLMDPAFKPSVRTPPRDVALDCGYSRAALLSAVGGTMTSQYVSGLSKDGLATYLDGLASSLRGSWTNANASAAAFVGEYSVKPQDSGDSLYFHGTKVGGRNKFLSQPEYIKNIYRASVLLKVGTQTLSRFYLDEIGERRLWIGFQPSQQAYPKAVLHLDGAAIASEPSGSSSEEALLSVSVSYMMGDSSHTYRLKRGTGNVYALPIGFGGDSPSGGRKSVSDALVARLASGAQPSAETTALSLSVAGQQWMSQVSMCLGLRSILCGNRVYDFYNIGVAGYDGSMYVDFGNRFGYYADMTAEMEGDSFFSSALEHAVLDQLNGASRPSVSAVRLFDIANSSGMRFYFATSNNYSAAISSLTGYDTAVKNSIQQRVAAGASALLPKSGTVSFNGWTGYGYAMRDHVNCVSGMIVSGGMNGGYCTVNAPPAAVEYVDLTTAVLCGDGSVVQTASADPVAMPDGAYCEEATDIAVSAGSQLRWTRYYDSRERMRAGGLGPGWSHGFDACVTETSDPDAFFGSGAVDAVVPAAIANAVVDDMLNGVWGACSNGAMARRWLVASMVAQWWTERTTGASVAVRVGSRSLRFFRRPDGSYAPQPGVTATLSRTAAGTYILAERHGNTYSFNGDGRLSSITDTSGNATILAYSSGRLSSVSNSFGASLSIAWSGDRISGVTDSCGRTVSYSYDSAGRLASVTDVRGKTMTYSYDPDTSALATKTDPLGNVVVGNSYSSLGQVTNQVSDTGGEWTFGYCRSDSSWDVSPDGGRRSQTFDERGRIVRDRLRDGSWVRFSYDGHGHAVCASNKFGRVDGFRYGENDLLLSSDVNVAGHNTAFAHDAELRVREVTNAVGGVTRYAYNSCHRIVATVLPDGSCVSNTWTSSGLLALQAVFGPDGRLAKRTDWTYSTSGLPLSKATFGPGLPASGVSEAYAYDQAGRMTSRTDANGHVRSYAYDNAGNVLASTRPDGAVSSFAYDDAGRLVSETDALGRMTSFVRTPSGKVAATMRPDGSVSTNVYDSLDRLVSATDGRGSATTFEYDAEGRLVRSTGPSGTSAFAYNAAGLQSAATNAAGGVTLSSYDFAGNPVCVTNTCGRGRWTGYDGLDRAVSVSDATGRTRLFEYDAAGRRASSAKPSGSVESYAYDALGNCVAFTNAEERAYLMSYDALGRMTAATNALGERVFAAQYDGVGNIVARIDGEGRQLSFMYDACDRLVSRTDSDGADEFSYDLAGNMTSASNGVAQESFSYDSMNRLAVAVSAVGGSVFTNAWQRDAEGLVTNIVYAEGKCVARVYDAAGRLASVVDWMGHEWTFSWNGLNLPTGGTSPGGTAHSLGYDACGNLTSWSIAGIAGRAILRDAEGRRLKDTVTAGPMPSQSSFRHSENTFDAADRLVSARVAYGSPGNVVGETYLYDGAGAMTNVLSGGDSLFSAAYDGSGRLAALGAAESSYDALGNRISLGGRFFIPDHSDPLKRPLVECDSDGTPVRYYIWGDGRLLGFVDSGGTLTVAHSDEQGSVVALTDDSGEVLFRACYGPHGEDWGSSGENPSPFAWLGGLGVMRLEAGARIAPLYLTRHRLYSPVLRRFLSPDPLGIAGGANLYAYAGGNPLAYVDPLGLCASGSSMPDLFDMMSGGISTAGQFLARTVDATWNLALELMVSNPNLRANGTQNGAYEVMVENFGSPLRRLGAYDEPPVVPEPEVVNAVWDLGAATTAYQNLGARRGVRPVIKESPLLSVSGTTVLYHGGQLENGVVRGYAFSTTPEYLYAKEYATIRGGEVFQFRVPNSFINENATRNLDSIQGTTLSGTEYRFTGPNVYELNNYMVK